MPSGRMKLAGLPQSFVLKVIGVLGSAAPVSVSVGFVRAVGPERVRPIGGLAHKGA